MTTTPINLHTCDVSDLYAACLELPLEEGLALADLLEERFGYGAGWKWMVQWASWPITSASSEWFSWWPECSYCREDVGSAVWDRLSGEHVGIGCKRYPFLSTALHDCARAAQAAIDAGEIEL